MKNHQPIVTPARKYQGVRRYPAPTREQCITALVRLEFEGLSIADFARQHGLRYETVYQVLTGQKKGRRGDAHRAAVLLGVKNGVIVGA